MGDTVRPAAVDDCRVLAYHAYLAGKSHLETSVYDCMFPGLPGPTDARLTLFENLMKTTAVSWLHYSFCSVAEVDGQVAASLSHYHDRDGAYRGLARALRELGWEREDLVSMAGRMRPFVEADLGLEEDCMRIENVATSPAYRRRGLACALIEDAASLGRREGFRTLQIGMLAGNDPAMAVYRKMGFTVIEEKNVPALETLVGSPGMVHLRLEL